MENFAIKTTKQHLQKSLNNTVLRIMEDSETFTEFRERAGLSKEQAEVFRGDWDIFVNSTI